MGGCHSCARILPKSSIAVLVPPCTPPDVFTDCFTGCLTPAACGWTLITPPTSVVFDGDMMIMASATDPVGRAEKPTLAPMPPAVFTVQFRFLEVAFPTSPGGAIYSVTITDSTLPVVITDIRFLGSGLVLITHVSGSVFSGPWVPAGLSTPHTVHYSVDGAGVPTLFVDGVPHPVAPTAPFPRCSAPATSP